MIFRWFLLILLLPLSVLGQSTNLSLNEDYYHWLDRYEVKSGKIAPELFTTFKPYKRQALAAYVDSLQARHGVFSSAADSHNLEYFRNDNWEWSRPATSESRKPVLRKFYKKRSDFVYLEDGELDLHINPVLYLGGGTDSGQPDNLFMNTRGVDIRGMVDRKIGFYTSITENQAVLPSHVQFWMLGTDVVPHEGFWKDFKASGVDFFQARGYIDFSVSKSIYMQLGHDRMFVGNGYRSLIYSDFAPPQLYWRTNVKVWKLNYLFQINRMVADPVANVPGLTAGKYPEKYVAFHHASINVGKKLNFGFFESVVFSPLDPFKGAVRNSLELNYFNPIIFYRAIEQQFGSSDNVLLGVDYKWLACKGISLYGQFVLDEFLLANARAGNGWRANKWALQQGVKYIDAFTVPNLDLQAEFNIARPYTYSHNTAYGNYSAFRQPLAHPLGANFREWVGIVRYQPLDKLNLIAKAIMMESGKDLVPDQNWGGDILKDNSTFEREFGNTIGQGNPSSVLFIDFTASYMAKHNLFFDAKFTYRQSQGSFEGVLPSTVAVDQFNRSLLTFALRFNFAQRLYEF